MKTVCGVVLFSGTDPLSKLIRKLTRSRWSHVGLLLQDEQLALWCFEATGSAQDVLLRGRLPCVQLNKWSTVLAGYAGRVAVRWLVQHPLREVSAFVDARVGLPYEQHVHSLLKALDRRNECDGSDSFFCSELVAATLQNAGCLSSEGMRADNYLPRDFAPESQRLDLEPGVVLAQPVVYKRGANSCWCC